MIPSDSEDSGLPPVEWPSLVSRPGWCSLGTACPYLPNLAPVNSAKRRSGYSTKTETGRNGLPTPVRFADERLVLRKPGGDGFQSGIGHQWRTRRAKCRCAGSRHSVRAWSRGSDCVHLTPEATRIAVVRAMQTRKLARLWLGDFAAVSNSGRSS